MDCSEGCEKCTAEQRVYYLRRLLVALSKSWKRLPRSIFLQDVQLQDNYPKDGGSYGDIFLALFRRKCVALKWPRFYSREPRTENKEVASILRNLHSPSLLFFLNRNSQAFRREALVSLFLNHTNVQSFMGVVEEPIKDSTPILSIITPWQRNGSLFSCLKRLKGLGLPILPDVWVRY